MNSKKPNTVMPHAALRQAQGDSGISIVTISTLDFPPYFCHNYEGTS
jgi:hypothetical protein